MLFEDRHYDEYKCVDLFLFIENIFKALVNTVRHG